MGKRLYLGDHGGYGHYFDANGVIMATIVDHPTRSKGPLALIDASRESAADIESIIIISLKRNGKASILWSEMSKLQLLGMVKTLEYEVFDEISRSEDYHRSD